MKKISVLFLILALLGTLLMPGFAASTDYVRLEVDLTEEEAATIDTLAEAIQDNFGIEAFFLYDDVHEGGEEFVDYAERYMKYTAKTDDATIFAISSKSYYVASQGDAKKLVSNDDADTLYEAVRYSDEHSERYNAAVHYYAALQALLAQRITDGGTSITTIGAAEDPDIPYIPTEIASERAERLYDGANLLSDDEEAALLEKLNTLSEELQFDIVIVTAKSIGNRTPMEFADDYFDYNGFGYGEKFDGCLLLISMADRDWWVSTCGYGEEALLSEYFPDYLELDDFYSDLKDGAYNDCFLRFADLVNDFVTEARENKPYSSSHRYNDLHNKLIGAVISLAIGLLIAAIVTLSKRKSYLRAVHSKAGAGEYLVEGSMRLYQQYDRFINKNVSRTRRQTESSSSGGGSHSSSSGRSHGGGGGKF